MVCYSKTECLPANPEDVTKRWVEYFNELLNGNDTVTSPDLHTYSSTENLDRRTTASGMEYKRHLPYPQERRCKSLFEL